MITLSRPRPYLGKTAPTELSQDVGAVKEYMYHGVHEACEAKRGGACATCDEDATFNELVSQFGGKTTGGVVRKGKDGEEDTMEALIEVLAIDAKTCFPNVYGRRRNLREPDT